MVRLPVVVPLEFLSRGISYSRRAVSTVSDDAQSGNRQGKHLGGSTFQAERFASSEREGLVFIPRIIPCGCDNSLPNTVFLLSWAVAVGLRLGLGGVLGLHGGSPLGC